MRWFVFQKKEFDIATIVENEEYVEFFVKHLKSDIAKLCKKWKTVKENIVFCSDCQRCHIWRNDIFVDYKGNRIANENFNGDIFNVFNKTINDMSLQKASYDRLEADDVVYLVQKKLKEFDCTITIVTNDNDYLQLIDTNVQVFNMQSKDISIRGQGNSLQDLYQKVIFGDKSDNIQKISPTMTKEKSIELSKLSLADIKKWVKEENAGEQFELNMNLISFENIPKNIIENFYKEYTISSRC